MDSAAYQVERRLSELGDAAPPHERARAEMLIADAREAVQDQAPVDRVRSLTSELQQVYAGLMAAQTGPDGAGPNGSSVAGADATSDEDVIDADFDRT